MLLSLAVIAILVIPVGTSVFILGFIFGDSPCVLCWAQRTGMVIISLIGIFILRYGPRPRYLGLGILVGAAGIYMSLRHSSLHILRDVGQGFSIEILGAHTYIWALFIYWFCVVAIGIALLLMKEGDATGSINELGVLGKIAQWAFFIVVGANIFQAVTSTGPPPFMGQSDPVRYSFNPKRWVWSLEEWEPYPISFRGRWAIDKPSISTLDSDPRRGPLANLREIRVKKHETLSLNLNGDVTDIAYNDLTDQFLLTTKRGGVYIIDGAMREISRYTVIDPGFSIDLSELNGAAFIDSQTVAVLADNKSYVILKKNDKADADKNYRFFLESFDRVDEIDRSRFSTIRAKMMYVMSLGYDAAGSSFYTITVPNNRHKKLVISRFDKEDMTLSEEYSPTISSQSGLQLKDTKRSIDEYYVTGIAIKNGLMYAISAAYHTLLVIDLEKREIISADAVDGISKPNGIAIKGADLYIIGDKNDVDIIDLPLSN